MKKIFLFIVLFMSVIHGTSALEFYSENSSRFDLYSGKQLLPNITIKANQSNDITKDKGIHLLIADGDYYRFDPTSLKNITFSGSGSIYIGSGLSISQNMRDIFIPIQTTFSIGDSITFSGLGVIIYDREQGYRSMGIDVTGDTVPEIYDINGIRIDGINPRRDLLPPNEITNFTGNLTSTGVILRWDNPGDIDFSGIKIEFFESTEKTILFEDTIYGLEQYIQMDVKKISNSVRIRSIDKNNNISEGFVSSLDSFRTPTNTTPAISVTGAIFSITSTGVIVSTTGAIIKTEKITFSFKSSRFSIFTLRLDILTDKKIVKLGETVREKLTIIRNNIIQTLLDYDAGLIGKNGAIIKLSELIREFNGVK